MRGSWQQQVASASPGRRLQQVRRLGCPKRTPNTRCISLDSIDKQPTIRLQLSGGFTHRSRTCRPLEVLPLLSLFIMPTSIPTLMPTLRLLALWLTAMPVHGYAPGCAPRAVPTSARAAAVTPLFGRRQLLGSAAPQHGQSAGLAVPQLVPGASSGRAWRLSAARYFREETGPLGHQALPRVLELAASTAADFTAFDPSGRLRFRSAVCPACRCRRRGERPRHHAAGWGGEGARWRGRAHPVWPVVRAAQLREAEPRRMPHGARTLDSQARPTGRHVSKAGP